LHSCTSGALPQFARWLGGEARARIWAEGQGMSLEEALAVALRGERPV
jgi:hypothetical protein